MEARKRKILDDLLDWPEERVELIDGEIVKRPLARSDHGLAQTNGVTELRPFGRRGGPGGWWIITEVSVSYEPHQCPSHDIAGWRKARLPERPSGVIDLPPDWVCEIVSPGHERKDTLKLFALLQRHSVPHYWLIWPEDRALIAYTLDGTAYRVERMLFDERTARVPPFEEIELDLDYILGRGEG
jgi:Uma2 family endonuclease